MTGASGAKDAAISDTGDLLELLQAADGTFGTVRARYRLWRHHESLSAAFLADAGRSGGAVAQAVERERALAESEEIVSDTESCGGVGIRQSGPFQTPRIAPTAAASVRSSPRCFIRTCWVAALHLTPVARAARAEREVIVVEAIPRGNPARGVNVDLALLEIGRGADRFRLEFDAERGIVLASHALTDGKPFSTIEAVEVAYDEQLDESLFELPRGWHMHCSYFDGSPRPRSPPLVAITYRSDAADEGLTISENPAGHEHPLAHTSGWRDATATVRVSEVIRMRVPSRPQISWHSLVCLGQQRRTDRSSISIKGEATVASVGQHRHPTCSTSAPGTIASTTLR